jgi:hypothetical protein
MAPESDSYGLRHRMVGLTATVSTLVTATARKCYVTVLWGCKTWRRKGTVEGCSAGWWGSTTTVSTLVTATAKKRYVTVLEDVMA